MAHIFEITDIRAPELRPYTQLTHAQLRSRRHPEQGILIAESAKVIACALNAGCRPVSFLMERRQLPAFAEQFQDRCGDVPVYTADREVLAQLTGYALTRGMLCAMRRPALPAMEDLCRNARRIAVLEHITDSSNVGAIFRCAAALGMDAVLAAPLLLRPVLPALHPGEHGDGVPDPLDLDRRGVAHPRPLPPEGTGVSDGGPGSGPPLHLH